MRETRYLFLLFSKIAAFIGIFLLFFYRDFYSYQYLEMYRRLPYQASWGNQKILLPTWINTRVQDHLGYSLLFYAVQKSDLSNLRRFLQRGGDPNTRNIWGQTPVHLAAMYGQVLSIRMMKRFGAQVDIADQYQKTPIFYATKRGAADSVRLLYSMGANLFTKDNMGKTLLDEAIRRNYRNIVLFLLGRTSSSSRNQREEVVTYLQDWQERYVPVFQIRPLFSYGVSYYLCATLGALFFTKQEARDIEYSLLQKRRRKDPKAIFRWLPFEWP